MNSKQTEEQQALDEKIQGIVTEIFYSPATNDKALESISNGIRKVKELLSGYAAAPAKGMRKYNEDAPDKAYLAFKKHFPTGSGEFMTTWINGYVAAIRDTENESFKTNK